jgi:hypothetical protein
MSSPEEPRITVPVQNIRAARALEVVQFVIADPERRRVYKAEPQRAFTEAQEDIPEDSLKKARYGDIPDKSRAALEALSVEELELLSNLDRTFIEDGLYVDVPSPGRLHYK